MPARSRHLGRFLLGQQEEVFGGIELSRDPIGITEVEVGAQLHVADGSVCDTVLVKPPLPLLQLCAGGRGESEMIQPAGQLGEGSVAGQVMNEQAEGEAGLGMHQDPAVADIHDGDEVEDLRVKASLTSRSVTVSTK